MCLFSENFLCPDFGRLFLTADLFYGFYFNIDGQQGQLFAAFRAFSIILLQNFIRGLKFCAFV
jgi:hypothetical protein